MHEMGIAGSVLEAVEKEARRYPGHRAAKVGLRIGRFAGVDGESLRFCFEALVKDSDFEPLELAIEFAQGDELDLAFVELEEIVGQAFRPAAGLRPGAGAHAPSKPCEDSSPAAGYETLASSVCTSGTPGESPAAGLKPWPHKSAEPVHESMEMP